VGTDANATTTTARVGESAGREYQPLLCDVTLLEFVVQLLQLGLQLRVRLSHDVPLFRRQWRWSECGVDYGVAIRDMSIYNDKRRVEPMRRAIKGNARVKNGQKEDQRLEQTLSSSA
jgi:hypothetical protein